jgi:hypothetical protein
MPAIDVCHSAQIQFERVNGGHVRRRMMGEGFRLKADSGSGRREYEAPSVRVLGSLHELTLTVKYGKVCDITCFHQASG